MTKKTAGPDKTTKTTKLVEVVDQLFNAEDLEALPEGFESIDPGELIREIGRQAEASHSGKSIILPADSPSDAAKNFLQALADGRGNVTGNELDAAWAAIRLSMDFQISGDEAWCPRILPNGGVAWRNYHRVLGFDNDLHGSIGVNVIAFRKELADLATAVRQAKDPDLDDPNGFGLLHRDDNGLSWTRDIPESLSSFGQTLVILPAGWITFAAPHPERWPVVGHSLLQQTSQSSRRGMAVLRVFRDRIFVYGFYRSDDDYDTILERFGDDLGGEGPNGQPVSLTITTDTALLKTRVADALRLSQPALFQDLYVEDITKFLAEKALFDDYAQAKTYQILHWMPIFGESPSAPATERTDALAFLAQAAQVNYQLAIVQFSPGLVNKIRGLGAAITKRISKAIPESLLNGARLCIPDVSSQPQDPIRDEWIVDYGSPEAKLRFDALESEWHKTSREEKQLYGLEEEDFLQEQQIRFAVLLQTSDTDPAFWHGIGLAASEAVEGTVHVLIPLYGYCQGYDCGDLDTGNHEKFIDQPD